MRPSKSTSGSNGQAARQLLSLLLTPRLSMVELELTTACPCRCITCGSNCGRATPNELSTDELVKTLRDVSELGCSQVTLLGGEPLCRPDLMVIVQKARALRLIVGVVTSGMGLDQRVALELKAAGVNSVTVSVDGLEQGHDAQRGVTGSYTRAIQAIGALRAARVAVGVNTQVNRTSLPDLEPLGDRLLEAGAMGWQLQATLPMGRAAGLELILQPSDMPILLSTLRRLSQRLRLAPYITDAIGWWTTDDARLRSTPGSPSRCWAGCFAGILHMGVTSQGHVKGCLALSDEFIEGNVRGERIADIWADPTRFAYNRAYRTDSLSGSCAECEQASLCRGGCTASAVAFHGRPGRNDNCLLLAERTRR